MRALEHLPAQSCKHDLASIQFHLRDNLRRIRFLETQPMNGQPAARLDRQQRRLAGRVAEVRTRYHGAACWDEA